MMSTVALYSLDLWFPEARRCASQVGSAYYLRGGRWTFVYSPLDFIKYRKHVMHTCRV